MTTEMHKAPSVAHDTGTSGDNATSVARYDLSTSEGGRRYVADFFARELRRHDFARYITTTLAADFACVLAQHLAATGKQQVGEVQVDGLATIIAALEHSKPTHDHYPDPVKRHADALAHARVLAAHQPVHVQGSDELRARTDGERAAYREGVEEGTKIAARQPAAWNSMDTAPKDGTEILIEVELRAGVGGRCLVGHYMRGGHCIEDHPPIAEGWYFWNGCAFDKAAKPIRWRHIQPAQGIDLGQVREIRIPARNNLDHISVFVQDQAAGRGRIVVTCYGNAWQAFWGAMGDRTVMEFVAQCDADYVAGNMISGRQTRMTKAERAYTERIAAEVIAEFRTLIDQRDAAPGVGNG